MGARTVDVYYFTVPHHAWRLKLGSWLCVRACAGLYVAILYSGAKTVCSMWM